jgi:hypothetical protein
MLMQAIKRLFFVSAMVRRRMNMEPEQGVFTEENYHHTRIYHHIFYIGWILFRDQISPNIISIIGPNEITAPDTYS